MRSRKLLVGAMIIGFVFGLGGATDAGAVSLFAPTDPGGGGDGLRIDPGREATSPALPVGDVQNLTTLEEFATIQAAIDDTDTVAGHILEVQVASHSEGIVTVNKAVTIRGSGGGSEILATTSTGSSGDAAGWFLMTVGGVAFENLDFDGTGFNIYQCLRFKEEGSVSDCSFTEMKAPSSSYSGIAVVGFKNLTVSDCVFTEIGRIGVILFGADVTAGVVERATYTGKGDGDWLDYGVELGGGAVATLTANTVTACTGVALVDSSSSAGILMTDYFGPGTSGSVQSCFINGNTSGIGVGYLETDETDATISECDLSGNVSRAVSNWSTAVTVNASANWLGTTDAGVAAGLFDGSVDYSPWLASGADQDLGTPGFQGDFSTVLSTTTARRAAGPA